MPGAHGHHHLLLPPWGGIDFGAGHRVAHQPHIGLVRLNGGVDARRRMVGDSQLRAGTALRKFGFQSPHFAQTDRVDGGHADQPFRPLLQLRELSVKVGFPAEDVAGHVEEQQTG